MSESLKSQILSTPYNLRKRKERPVYSSKSKTREVEATSTKSRSTTAKSKASTANDELTLEQKKEDSDEEVKFSARITRRKNSDEEEFEVSTKKAKKNRTSSSKRQSRGSDVRLSSTSNTSSLSVVNDNLGHGESSLIMVNLNSKVNTEINHEDLKLPYWIQPENIKDKDGRRPEEEGYDPTTLYIRQRDLDRLAGVQKRYWEIKSNYFDKLVAYKFGHFYFFYFKDALIVHRLLDLRLDIYKNRFSTFFHEKHMKENVMKILDQGYKVAVVEQMETAQTKEEDLARREVVQVLTRGTATDFTDSGYSPRFCLCLFEKGSHYGVVFLDTTTHDFFLGEFEDNAHKGTLKTLLTRLKPLEIVYINDNLSQETLSICKNLSHKPSLNHNKLKGGYSTLNDIIHKIEVYFSENEEWPQALESMRIVLGNSLEDLKKIKNKERRRVKEEGLPFYFVLQSLGLCLTFLEGIMLAETVFKMGNFSTYDVALEKKSSLYLDSQALESLEIFNVGYQLSRSETTVGSLFHYMDKTVTDFGKRMLARWIASPLLDSEKISERLDAIEDLTKHSDALDTFQKMMKDLPDLERTVHKIYNLSNRKRMSAVYFEDFAKNRLKDFLAFLDELNDVQKMMQHFQGYAVKFNSKRLRQLIFFQNKNDHSRIEETDSQNTVTREESKVDQNNQLNPEQNERSNENLAISDGRLDNNITRNNADNMGIFPEIRPVVKKLKDMVTVVDGLPMPAKGTNEEGDKLFDEVGKIKTRLQAILEQEKRFLGFRSVHYVHSRYRYELEIPENLIKNRPEDYVLTSKRIGFLRFHTPKIEECIRELEELEAELQKILVDFIVEYFKIFYDDNLIWKQVVICLGELDCLCGLARLAANMNVKCRPDVMNMAKEEENIFELRGMVHPSLAGQMGNICEAETKRIKVNTTNSQKEKKRNSSNKRRSNNETDQTKTTSQINRSDSNKRENVNTESDLMNLNSSNNLINNPSEQIVARGEEFVRNDVIKKGDVDIFLITGPNMGGKSTLLRQTALAVVMAQTGSMVPAEKFRFNAIDRIFTRIGAGDKIFEGKSTFFLEMEETSNIVEEATRNSLLLIDELGRGTSTYDGVSLAYGTLKYIADKTRSITLFATHYHILLEEFKLYKNIENYCMASDYDEETENIKFSYKFSKGQAERSHSFAVAKLAGLPLETIKNAKERAAFLTKEKVSLAQLKSIDKKFNGAVQILQKLKREQNIERKIENLLNLLQ